MPGKKAADMGKMLMQEKHFCIIGHEPGCSLLRGTYYIRGGERADCCRLHSDDCSMGAAQVQSVTESWSALEEGLFIPFRAHGFHFARREQALFQQV